jgi:demethylmenaquinone methyltransferase/2-methoxy-6-polyprenyl-1,4-benzoquinol methylase
MSSILENFRDHPDRLRALTAYRRHADGYDATCGRIESIRARALAELAPAPGETVLDVACGTGPMLPALARAVGPAGRVVGIEQSPEMAARARRRAQDAGGGRQVRVVERAVEDLRLDGPPADAVLMCWTHDVLQSPAALDALCALARPGARIVLAGMITLPWAWGWPVNAVNLWRARHYMTTWANLDRPWRGLEARGARLRLVRRALWGSAYVATGTLSDGAPATVSAACAAPTLAPPARTRR